MAYAQSWDESAPTGSEDAGTIDDIIRNLKIALRERLEQVIPDFGDDTVDPKFVERQVEGIAGTFDDSQSAGDKAIVENDLNFMIAIGVANVTSNASGRYTLDLNEFDDLTFSISVTGTNRIVSVTAVPRNAVAGSIANVIFVGMSGATNELVFEFYDYTGSVVASSSCDFDVVICVGRGV